MRLTHCYSCLFLLIEVEARQIPGETVLDEAALLDLYGLKPPSFLIYPDKVPDKSQCDPMDRKDMSCYPYAYCNATTRHSPQRGTCRPYGECRARVPWIKQPPVCSYSPFTVCCYECGIRFDARDLSSCELVISPYTGELETKCKHGVVGGVNAFPNSWPWMALFGSSSRGSPSYSWYCQGSLITDRHILTAAHCLRNGVPDVVRLGEHDLNGGNGTDHLDVQVKRIVPHPKWKHPEVEYDIGIVELTKPVTFSVTVRPICLPLTGGLELTPGKTMGVVTGWGALGSGSASSDILQEVYIPIISNTDCDEAYKTLPAFAYNSAFPTGLPSSVFCAQESKGGKDACQGDSGGPYQVTSKLNDGPWTLAGVVSAGQGCGSKLYAGLYTRVDHHLPWIHSQIGT